MAERVLRDEGLRSKFMPMIVNEARKRGVITGNATSGWTIRKTVASGIQMIYVVRMQEARVEMWINIEQYESFMDKSEWIFNRFYAKKDQIENAYGGELTWDYPGRRTAFSIQQDYPDFDLRETEKWNMWVEKMVSDMEKLDAALKLHWY